MGSVWCVRYENTYDSDHDLSVFASQDEALRAASFAIMNEINNNWLLADPNVLSIAVDIDNLIAKKSWQQAIDLFNEESSNSDYGVYYTVWDQKIESFNDVPDRLCLDISDSGNNTNCMAGSFPLDQGATCRSCGTHNEYATPDQSDLTYVCRQCKVFQSIFT